MCMASLRFLLANVPSVARAGSVKAQDARGRSACERPVLDEGNDVLGTRFALPGEYRLASAG
jgi:hypothetical protein